MGVHFFVSTDLVSLASSLNSALADGYELYGDPFVLSNQRVAQMVRKPEPKPEPKPKKPATTKTTKKPVEKDDNPNGPK